MSQGISLSSQSLPHPPTEMTVNDTQSISSSSPLPSVFLHQSHRSLAAGLSVTIHLLITHLLPLEQASLWPGILFPTLLSSQCRASAWPRKSVMKGCLFQIKK